ncbi:MAG: 6-bladed beta-propeller [Bacteroidales bacterium]|nr:6-bladed beta-propeller [Bacteroidales bacterium]
MKKVFYILLLILIASCSNTTQTETKYFENPNDSLIKIDLTEGFKQSTRTLDEMIDSISIIPLQTDDNTLVSQILDIKVTDKYFYIKDNYQNGSLVIFDREGNFIKRLPFGNGPQEVNHVQNVYPDYDNNLLYVNSSDKISIFTEDGNYISNFVKDNYVYDFSIVNNNLYYVTVMGVLNTIVKRDTLSNENQLFSSGFPIDDFLMIKYKYFQKNKDILSFTFPLNKNIYYLKNDTIIKKYIISFDEFEKKNLSIEDYQNRFSNFNNEYIFEGNYLETNTLQYFMFLTKDTKSKEIYRNKKTGEIWSFKPVENSFCNQIKWFFVADADKDYFVSYIMPENIDKENSVSEEKWDRTNLNGKISDSDMAKLENTQIDDNPLIILYKLKDIE